MASSTPRSRPLPHYHIKTTVQFSRPDASNRGLDNAPAYLHPPGRGLLARLARSGWAALLFFVLASSVYTWPLVTRLQDTLPDWGDAADVGWRIGSIAQQLRLDPLHLYATKAFYPLTNGLALDELVTGQALLAAPFIWLTSNLTLAYNLLNFSSYVLSGFAMWLLVRRLTDSGTAGLVAGAIFAFSPWHIGQYGHLGLGAQEWMVFALYFLLRFLETSNASRRTLTGKSLLELSLFTIFFVLQALAVGYYAFFETILVGLFLAYYFAFGSGAAPRAWQVLRGKKATVDAFDWRRLARQFGLLALAGLVALAILIPFVLPFVQAQSQSGFERSLNEVSYWSAGVTSLLRTTTHSWLYAPVEVGLFGLQTSTERELYPGLVTLLLALAGIFAPLTWKAERRVTSAWLFGIVALTGLVLSFGPSFNLEAYGEGPTGIVLPYLWLYNYLPGFDALRVPQRFGMLMMLGLAVCAGYGVARLQLWSRKRAQANSLVAQRPRAVGGVALALVLAEFFAFGMPAVPTPTGAAAPPLYNWLASNDASKVIGKNDLLLELPVGQTDNPINTNPIYLVYGLSHNRPMLNGSSNIVPRGYDRLFYEMRRFPTPGTLDIIQGLGVKFVVVHTGGLLSDAKRQALGQEAAQGGRLQLVESFPDFTGGSRYKDEVYRVIPDSTRLKSMAEAIPTGSTVLLADQQAVNRRLYTTVIPALLGPSRIYFSPYTTIYDNIIGKIKPAQPGAKYDYVILYSNTDPAQYGYSASDMAAEVDLGDNNSVRVYHKYSKLP